MSYLLQALKKAEADRSRLVDTEALAIQPAVSKSSLPTWLIALVATLLILTIVKLIYGFASEQVNEPVAQSLERGGGQSARLNQIASGNDKQEEKKADPQYSAYVLQNGETLIRPAVESSDEFESELAKVAANTGLGSNSGSPVESSAAIEVSSQPRQLAELSKAELNTIPSLSLESHLYSSVAEYSSVVINGQAYSEGSYLSSDVVIKKINANGIIILVGANLVELPKGITWVSTNYAK
jgi:hypothetical protein